MSTGCSPIDLEPPGGHAVTHYGDVSREFGALLWYMMMGFERYNKKLKALVRNATHPLASLKFSLLRDAGCSHYPR